MTTVIDYTQARAGDGSDGPLPDNWTPWKSRGPLTRHQLREMAVRKHLREAGMETDGFRRPYTFTLWHYREGDPVHPNGRPQRVHAVTFVCHPKNETV